MKVILNVKLHKKQFGFKVGIFLIYFSSNPLFRLLIGAQIFDSLLNKDFKKKKKCRKDP